MAVIYNNIGGVYLGQLNFMEARKWYLKALIFGKTLGAKETISLSYLSLSSVDSALGNYKNSLENYKMYIIYHDSLNNEENTKKTVQTQMQYEFEKKQAAEKVRQAEERKVIKARLEKEKTQRYALFGGLVLVIVFAGFMFNRFKVAQKQKKLIEIKEQEAHRQKEIIEEKQKEIIDSIRYAKRIQLALLPTEKYLDKWLKSNAKPNLK